MPELFEWLEGHDTRERGQLTTISGKGQIYQPVYGHLGLRTLRGSSLEIIRFTARNKFCVNLDYTDNDGRRSSRVIEPYSLRQIQNGNVLLYAVGADDGQIQAYNVNQIIDASVANRVFVPRYQIEINSSSIVAPVMQAVH